MMQISLIALIFLSSFFAVTVTAQLTPVRDPAAEQKYVALEKTYLWLEHEIQLKKSQVQEGNYPRRELIDEIKGMEARLLQVRVRMLEELTGVELNIDIEKAPAVKRDVFNEVQELIIPLLDGLKRASERPRKIEKLHVELERLKVDETSYKEARQLFEERAGFVKEESKIQLLNWIDHQLNQIELEKQTRERELGALMGDKRTVVEQLRDLLSVFFRTKGKHLALALAFLMLSFWATVVLKPHFFRLVIRPRTRHLQKFFLALYHVFTLLVCMASFLLSLYFLNDWVLFTISLFLVFAMAWSLKQFIPTMLDQLRLMLNLGMVREGERLMWEGLPWRVESINVMATLVNEELEGARLRLFAKHLLGKMSRPQIEDESWFPTRKGDWIAIEGGPVAQVVQQTVDQVTVRYNGGSLVHYPSAQFFTMSFQHYRHGLRISAVMGIDYAHQALACDEVLKFLCQEFEARVRQWPESSDILHVLVEFESAAASSLNYWVALDCDAALAPKRDILQRRLQHLFVELCNQRKLNIPFAQMTLSARDDFWPQGKALGQ